MGAHQYQGCTLVLGHAPVLGMGAHLYWDIHQYVHTLLSGGYLIWLHQTPSCPCQSHCTQALGVSKPAGNMTILHLYFLTCSFEREHLFVVWLLMCFFFFFFLGRKTCPIISRFLALEILYSGCFVLFCFIFCIISQHLTPTTGYALVLHIILRDIMQGLEGSG